MRLVDYLDKGAQLGADRPCLTMGDADLSYGEVPERLRSIYLFCKRHLIHANVRQEPEAIDAVVKLLADLREAWDTIASQSQTAAPALAATA